MEHSGISITGDFPGINASLFHGQLQDTHQKVSVVKLDFTSTEKLMSFIDYADNLVTFNPLLVNCLG